LFNAGVVGSRSFQFIFLCGNAWTHFGSSPEGGITVIDVRNEQAADTWRTLSAVLPEGWCGRTSAGVAHINALTGFAIPVRRGPHAFDHRATDSATVDGTLSGYGHSGISRPLCKFAQWVDRPERIPLAVQEAFSAALTSPGLSI